MLLKPVLPVFEYICNYNYIITELCENRDNIIMGCNGKCYLIKELAKASETEKPLSSDKKHTPTETADLFLSDCHHYEFSVPEIPTATCVNTAYSNLYAHLATDAVFHPPTIIS